MKKQSELFDEQVPSDKPKGKSPFPDPFPEDWRAPLQAIATTCGVELEDAIEDVRDWALGGNHRKTDWVATIRGAMRKGWAGERSKRRRSGAQSAATAMKSISEDAGSHEGDRPAQGLSARHHALGILLMLSPQESPREAEIQMRLRLSLCDGIPEPIFVEACRRLAQTWTWPSLPKPGDIHQMAGRVRADCRRLQAELDRRAEFQAISPSEAREILEQLEMRTPDNEFERLADAFTKQGCRAVIRRSMRIVA